MFGMPRPRLHSTDEILDAARTLVLSGVRRATLAEIIAASGAPKGTIYHRFGSLEDLLARLWIRAIRRFQDGFMSAIAAEDAIEAAIAGAVWMHEFADVQAADARLLASLRREDLIGSVNDPRLQVELEHLNDKIAKRMRDLARRLYGTANDAAIAHTRLATVDLAHGAVRRYLVAGQAMPRGLREQIVVAVRAVLSSTGAHSSRRPAG
jgi:AcrR family transcriptional regulator